MRVLSFIHCRYLNQISMPLFLATIAKGLSQRADHHCWKQRIFNVMRVRLKQGYTASQQSQTLSVRMILPTIRACFRVNRRLQDFTLQKWHRSPSRIL